jgi:hypothetical protein
MFLAIDNARFEKLFARHGGTVIGHEVLRRQKSPLPIVVYLEKLCGAVMKMEEGPVTDLDERRKKYTLDICTALSSIYFKQVRWRLFLRDDSEIQQPLIDDDLPAALAATGKTQLILNRYANNPKGLLASCSCLPSPLEAAAACNQTDLVRSMLDVIPEVHMTADRHRSIFSALVSAMRVSAAQSGHMLLFHYLSRRRATPRLLKEAVKYADVGFVVVILQNRQQQVPPQTGLTIQETRHVLKEGTPSVLHTLLSHHYIDPNYLDDTTPLTLTIQNHRYDLARVLLQHGAHVNGVPRTGKLVTPLWHAAKMGFRGYGDNRLPGIRFLLQHGANPDIHGDWRSPLRAAEGWVDACFLLKLAKERGEDGVLGGDVWREFGKQGALEGLKGSEGAWGVEVDGVCLSD